MNITVQFTTRTCVLTVQQQFNVACLVWCHLAVLINETCVCVIVDAALVVLAGTVTFALDCVKSVS